MNKQEIEKRIDEIEEQMEYYESLAYCREFGYTRENLEEHLHAEEVEEYYQLEKESKDLFDKAKQMGFELWGDNEVKDLERELK